jgi:hypothetical protein
MDTYYCFRNQFLKGELEFAKLPTPGEALNTSKGAVLRKKSPAL